MGEKGTMFPATESPRFWRGFKLMVEFYSTLLVVSGYVVGIVGLQP